MPFNEIYHDWNHTRAKAIIDNYNYRFFSGKKIIDLGAGHGDLAASFLRLGADVLCVDAREENLEIIRKKHPALKTMRLDLDYEFPFEQHQFDVVISAGLLCHLKNYERHLENICNVAQYIILETEVLDSPNLDSKIQSFEDKIINDLSFNGEGSIISSANIQKRLYDMGATFKRLDDAKINSGPYKYNWTENNSGRNVGNRRLWVIRRDKFIAQKYMNHPQIFAAEIAAKRDREYYNQKSVTNTATYQPRRTPQSMSGRPIWPPQLVTSPNYTNNSSIQPLIMSENKKYFIHTADISENIDVNKIRLFYLKNNEQDICLQKNLDNKLLETILVNEHNISFNTLFQRINEITGPNDINIICNSGIFFDKTIILANNIKNKQVYALTCWDWHSSDNVIFRNAANSQDTWIFKGKMENISGDFPIGKSSCDNKIAYEFHKAGYKVINPSESIKTYYINSNNQIPTKKINGPHLFVIPTKMPPSKFDINANSPIIRLFYNYYEDKDPERKKEIDFCFQKNKENPLLDIVVIDSDETPTYNYFFEKINKITGPNDINIICNSDIFFDDTISLANKIGSKDMYALSRWDWINETSIKHRAIRNSQDVWIMRGKVENVNGDFKLGIPYCDNRIAFEFTNVGYKVSNPSLSIKTYHVHNSGVRHYKNNEKVPGNYIFVDITKL